MKVILKSEVNGLGKYGEIKDVKPGYARNFLFPKCLAVPFNEKTIKAFELEKQLIEKQKQKERENVNSVVEKLNKTAININVKTSQSGKLFGSVTKDDIAEAIKNDTQIDVSKHDIILDEPIKETGLYNVEIIVRGKKFSQEIHSTAKVKLWVVEQTTLES